MLPQPELVTVTDQPGQIQLSIKSEGAKFVGHGLESVTRAEGFALAAAHLVKSLQVGLYLKQKN